MISKSELALIDFTNKDSIYFYAKKMEGMTFQQIIDLGILPKDGVSKDYSNTSFKGSMGALVEERGFGYKANSRAKPDFEKANLELKVTPFKILKNKSLTAKERLVLSMISFTEIYDSTELFGSHFWEKNETLLLIYYRSDSNLSKLDQEICFVELFTPPAEDLEIIESDYRTIIEYIRAGKAHELSESLTNYLGACTKGQNAEKAWQDQSIYNPGVLAKRRAFSYKSSYMNYVLQNLINKRKNDESILKNEEELKDQTFEEFILQKIHDYLGMSEEELCTNFDIPFTKNKAQRTTIVYRILGLHSDGAAEFKKANITVRTTLINNSGKIREQIPLPPFEFSEIVQEEWETSTLRNQLLEQKFLFIIFQEDATGVNRIKGATFWAIPEHDLEEVVRNEWTRAVDTIKSGVTLEPCYVGNELKFHNNLPKISDSSIVHIRPHASESGYLLKNGIRKGNPEKYGSRLPSGDVMTRQSFWISSSYIASMIHKQNL